MGATDTITLNRILTTAASWHASDLHFVIGSQPVVRVDGRLTALEEEQVVTAEFLQAVIGVILTEDQRTQLAANKEMIVANSLNTQLRFKARVFYQRGSPSVSIHFVSSTLRRLAELGLPPAVQHFPQLTKGLILITGPYGSGRTTTLNAIINEINQTRNANIVTVEQPIEYLFANNKSLIEQREVGRDALSFEQAIRAASREDVDVIVVAEAEGREVVSALLDAAESSRLVVSTMNTDSVIATIEKILNSFAADDVPKARVQLSNVLAGIVSQQLLPKTGGGEVLVAEVIVPTPAVRAVVRDGSLAQLRNVLQTAGDAGTLSFDKSLASLVQQGIISQEDAVSHAQDPSTITG